MPPDADLTAIEAEYRAGRISAPVAAARLVMAGADDARILAATGTDAAGLRRLRPLLNRHDGARTIQQIAALFDAAVAVSPEASVAAYSLGDPATLRDATAEIEDWLSSAGLLGRDRDALDFGCGIGRVAAAVAPGLRSVLGVDVSPRMIAEAQKRCAAAANVRLAVTEGRWLHDCAAARFDLILAIDSFPYVMQADAPSARAHIADFARLLRPGGDLVVMNLSYRADAREDAADFRTWTEAAALSVTQDGAAPFRLWDGRVFAARRPP